jgi:hypothetical protein
LLIGSTPRALDLLGIELNSFVQPRDGTAYTYSRRAPAKGDPVWLDKLEKAQKDIARTTVAAALFKELFPRARALEGSCDKMLKTKGLPNSLDHALRLSAENLKSLVSFKPIEDRPRQLDAEHTKMVEMTNALEVHRFDQQLAELAVDITSARKVPEAIKVE